MEKEDYDKIAKEFGEDIPDKDQKKDSEEYDDNKETKTQEDMKKSEETDKKNNKKLKTNVIPEFKIKNGVALGFQIAIGFWFITFLLLMFTAAVLILFFGFSLPVIK